MSAKENFKKADHMHRAATYINRTRCWTDEARSQRDGLYDAAWSIFMSLKIFKKGKGYHRSSLGGVS